MNPRLRSIARTSARTGVRTVNTPIARLRAKRTIARAARPMLLEIGGLAPRPGWVVTNVNATTRNYLDATRRWPIEDGGVAYVYADNVIEHVPLEAARAMLAEAHRCLRPGGVIRLVTPDIGSHVELYLAGRHPADTPEAKQYEEMGLTLEHPIDLIRIPISSFGHHEGYVYDFDTLASELRRAGFDAVSKVELGTSRHEPLVALDNRGDEGGAQMAVEGKR